MKNLATAIAIAGLIGSPAFSADMAVKAPPSAPAPAPYTWTGFYAGIQFGGGWSHEAVNYSANDPASALLLSGGSTMTSQPVASGYRIPQSVLVGGFEAGYNWQWSNWLLGVETDFSFAGMSGQASGTSVVSTTLVLTLFQTTSAQQEHRLVWHRSRPHRAA